MRYVLRQKGAADRPCAIESLGEGRWQVTLDGESFTLAARGLGGGGWALLDDGGRSVEAWVHPGRTPVERHVTLFDGAYDLTLLNPAAALAAEEAGAAGGAVCAPMPGRLIKLLVATGDTVEAGQPVCVVEAMKMQNELAAPIDGIVKTISAKAGDQVAGGAALLLIESA